MSAIMSNWFIDYHHAMLLHFLVGAGTLAAFGLAHLIHSIAGIRWRVSLK
jgi:hypothetical protein